MTMDLQALGAALGFLLLYMLIFGIVLWYRTAKAYRFIQEVQVENNARFLDLAVRMDAADAWIQGFAAKTSTRNAKGRFTKQKRS